MLNLKFNLVEFYTRISDLILLLQLPMQNRLKFHSQNDSNLRLGENEKIQEFQPLTTTDQNIIPTFLHKKSSSGAFP